MFRAIQNAVLRLFAVRCAGIGAARFHLQHGVEFHVPLLALPPPARFVFAANETDVPILFPTRLQFYPQRFLRPASGRAPPCLFLFDASL